MYPFALIFGFVVAIDKRQSTPGWLKKPLQRESLPGKAGEALHSQTPAASEQPASSLPATEQQGAKERWQWGRQLAGSYSHKVSDSDLELQNCFKYSLFLSYQSKIRSNAKPRG